MLNQLCGLYDSGTVKKEQFYSLLTVTAPRKQFHNTSKNSA